jgi:hypothetical protein
MGGIECVEERAHLDATGAQRTVFPLRGPL